MGWRNRDHDRPDHCAALDLVERLETLAEQQWRSLDDVFDALLNSYAPASGGNWASAVARAWKRRTLAGSMTRMRR
ncbi:MAG: hypothetical protein IPK19_00130 [Chloroflexi bacterium]|nr:hypothetical protein [Chloroflexota bacterium]